MIAGLYDGLGPIGANLLVLAAGAEKPSELPAMMRRARADAMVYMGAFEPEILAEIFVSVPASKLILPPPDTLTGSEPLTVIMAMS